MDLVHGKRYTLKSPTSRKPLIAIWDTTTKTFRDPADDFNWIAYEAVKEWEIREATNG